ncbi:MAG: hypothetical protein ACQETE_01200 [Bacteroidota bacterium]|jgi:hypothetical protein
MTTLVEELNGWAILGSTIVYFVIGFIWYAFFRQTLDEIIGHPTG